MIEVCNKRNLVGEFGVCDIYVGRPSVLGNPFAMSAMRDRGQVISDYRDWLAKMIERKDQVVMLELGRIALAASRGTVRLFCWCAPLGCHGDVIKETVQQYLDTGQWSVRS